MAYHRWKSVFVHAYFVEPALLSVQFGKRQGVESTTGLGAPGQQDLAQAPHVLELFVRGLERRMPCASPDFAAA